MLRKIKINEKIYDVISPKEFGETCTKRDMSSSAVEWDGIVYPVVTNQKNPGVYINNNIAYYTDPSEEEMNEYSSDNIFDFNPKNMREVIEQSEMLRDLENEILTTSDDIFVPRIYKTDEPELKAMKEAIISKHIDFDKYESRIGGTFSNDKRIFTSSDKKTITLSKIKNISNALDIKATLILEDKSSAVANPMNKQIVIELTGGEDDDE